jgi:hypothetical protein
MKTNFKYIYLSLFLVFFISCSEDKIELTGKGTITGSAVTSGDFSPLQNVKISTNPASSIVFSDVDGNFEIPEVPINDYSIQAEKDGYLTQFEGITITDDSTINVIFEMELSTVTNRPPDTPVLDTPANNAIDQEVEVELIWSGSDPDEDVLSYSIEILNDQNSEVLEFTNIVDTTYTVSGLQYGFKYFWNVSATDNINDPTFSSVFAFETLPFPSNRYFFVRNINGNNVIFSGDDEGNELQLTSENSNSWRPRKGSSTDKIAFLRTNGGQTHIYTMNLDGSDIIQVTSSLPVSGFNLEELDFTWANNDTTILYPSFDKLYSIMPNGAGLTQIHQTPDGNFITEVDWNGQSSRIAIKTNNSSGYDVAIYTINTSGIVQDIVLENINGAAGGLDFSFDGGKLLYTHDISGNENSEYRQLDTNMFIYEFSTMTSDNVSDGKVAGTNDLDARFSPSEAELIFVNTSNDGISQKSVYSMPMNGSGTRTELFENAKMPDWK